MDEYIERIIRDSFKQKDADTVKELLQVVERDMSEASKTKRRKDVDYIISKK